MLRPNQNDREKYPIAMGMHSKMAFVRDLEAYATALEEAIDVAMSGADEDGNPFMGRTEHYEFAMGVLEDIRRQT